MIPWTVLSLGQLLRILHVCGGDPTENQNLETTVKYSPRMWRWSQFRYHFLTIKIVFSTSVEVILTAESGMHCGASILHVCGGDPLDSRSRLSLHWYSPRMWRWSQSAKNLDILLLVFSTYVEVILLQQLHEQRYLSILHVCGGDPYHLNHHPFQLQYSPHMWRWSWIFLNILVIIKVFSTHVESVTVLERTDK